MRLPSGVLFKPIALRRLRDAAGLTPVQLAGKAGLDPITIKLLEAGATTPHHSTLVKLAKALRVAIAALCDGRRS